MDRVRARDSEKKIIELQDSKTMEDIKDVLAREGLEAEFNKDKVPKQY